MSLPEQIKPEVKAIEAGDVRPEMTVRRFIVEHAMIIFAAIALFVAAWTAAFYILRI